MKVSKSRLAVLVLLVATVIYVVAFALSEWCYYSRLAEMMVELEAKGGVATLKPFLATSEGYKLFIGEIVICVVWIILLNLRVWKGDMNNAPSANQNNPKWGLKENRNEGRKKK